MAIIASIERYSGFGYRMRRELFELVRFDSTKERLIRKINDTEATEEYIIEFKDL